MRVLGGASENGQEKNALGEEGKRCMGILCSSCEGQLLGLGINKKKIRDPYLSIGGIGCGEDARAERGVTVQM